MSLLHTIKTNECIRKLFGRREIVIIEKQLLGVSLTQSEKNRLSRDIRKKFEAILVLARHKQEFELKKGAEIKKLINEAKETIINSKYLRKIKKIVLFGSAAENKLSLSSDIDLAVEFSDITKKDATKFRIEMSGRISDKMDIQVYNTLSEKIRKEIDEKGKIIYERKNK